MLTCKEIYHALFLNVKLLALPFKEYHAYMYDSNIGTTLINILNFMLI